MRGFFQTGLLSLSIRKLLKRKEQFPSVPVLDKAITEPWFGHKLHVCFVCSPNIQNGLNLKFFETNQGGAGCRWRAKEGFENYPGMIHGGIMTTILDELLGFSIYHETGMFAVSVKAKLQWRKPMNVGDEIIGWAKIVSRYKQFYKAEGFLYNQHGDCIQSMSGVYYTPNERLFRRLTGIRKLPEILSSHFYQG